MALTDSDRAKIRVENLSFYYGKNRVLKDNNIEIAENRVTAIIGPSGSGKSTHIRVYNRMFELYAGQRATGRVLLDGADVLDRRRIDGMELRSRVGMVFGKPTPFPMSVRDNVAFGLRLQGIRGAELEGRIMRALQDAALWDELKDHLEVLATSLPAGQQQRLCIARALAVEPDVLLLDDPASQLDPSATAQIEDLIRHMRGRLTVVMVTHNLQQAARVSDYTAFFYLGEVVEHAPTNVLFTRPAERRTEDYITGKFG